MKFSAAFPLALAIALTGCTTGALTAPDFQSFVKSLPLSDSQKALATQYVQDLTLSLQANSDQTVSELISSDTLGSYATMAANTPKVRAPKLKEHMDALKGQAKGRMDKRKAGMDIKKTETTNPDGSIDRVVTMEKTAGGDTIKRVVTRHYVVTGGNEELVSVLATREMTHKNGMILKSTRKKEINSDGTYKVTFDSTWTRKDGKVKTLHWVRTGAADGTETQVEGTLTRFDGTVVQLSTAKTADGKTTVSLNADGAKVEATQNEADEQVQVNTSAGSKTETKTVDMPEDGAPVAQPTEN